MEKTLQIVPLRQRANADTVSWLQRPMAERMAAVEELRLARQGLQGTSEAEPRIEKVCQVVKRALR